jgi:hypothetical protein
MATITSDGQDYDYEYDYEISPISSPPFSNPGGSSLTGSTGNYTPDGDILFGDDSNQTLNGGGQ